MKPTGYLSNTREITPAEPIFSTGGLVFQNGEDITERSNRLDLLRDSLRDRTVIEVLEDRDRDIGFILLLDDNSYVAFSFYSSDVGSIVVGG